MKEMIENQPLNSYEAEMNNNDLLCQKDSFFLVVSIQANNKK